MSLFSEEDAGVFFIAEAGVNHNGSLDTALEMVDAAAEAGADAIKFQTFNAERVISRFAAKAEYQKKTTGADGSQLDMVRRLELDERSHRVLRDRCRQVGIVFLSTPFDDASVDLLVALGVPFLKIPSGEITDLPYLRKVASTRLPLVVSTGMADLAEVRAAVSVLMDSGLLKSRIVLLQCNTEYPTPIDDTNLRAMVTLRDAFDVRVGFSDHTRSDVASIAAVAMGACVIEKHFTLDRSLPGPDHQASVLPSELQICSNDPGHGAGARRWDQASFQVRDSQPADCAEEHCGRPADNAAEVFTEANLTTKRPGTGVSPMRWDDVVGRRANRDYEVDELVEL